MKVSPHSALNRDRLPRPFSVGLSSLDPDQWIVPDDRLTVQLREKAALFARCPDAVYQAEAGTLDAQRELLDLLCAYLPRRYPDIWSVGETDVAVEPAGIVHQFAAFDHAPLELAGRIVQDDLVIMRKGADGYRIAAAAVCFPSTWVLAEKFARPLAEVHAPVPGFGPGTRNAGVIDRIFDQLKPGHPVQRCNWSLYEVPDLHHPKSHSSHTRWHDADGGLLLSSWLRAERQTLSRLPASGDVVFTIHVVVDAVSELDNHPDRVEIAMRLRDHIAGLDSRELAYKGLGDHANLVCAELEQIAAGELSTTQ